MLVEHTCVKQVFAALLYDLIGVLNEQSESGRADVESGFLIGCSQTLAVAVLSLKPVVLQSPPPPFTSTPTPT